MSEGKNGYFEHIIEGPAQGPHHRHPYSEVFQANPGGIVTLLYKGFDGRSWISVTNGFTWVGPNVYHTVKFSTSGGRIFGPVKK